MNFDLAAIQVKLGKRIGEIREKKELSERELADLVNVSFSYIVAIEDGARDPQLSTIVMIAKGLNVEIDQLFCSSSSLE